MRARGISYDTGFLRNGRFSRADPDPEVIGRELRIIRDDLHCNAVRVMGGDPDRLDLAARLAADLGLEVWYSPYPLDLDADEILALFAECAERAERLRRGGADVVFVAGAELSLMNPGFLAGDTLEQRLDALLRHRDRLPAVIAEVTPRINAFLGRAAAVVRERFGGPITYAAVPLERVDWSPFDIVSVDLYRSAEVADAFADGVRTLVSQGKPVAITEFGCATFAGAPDRGATGLDIVVNDENTDVPSHLDGEYVRDEAGQARYVRELLEIFDAEGVDATFVFTFALHDFPHRPGDSRRDLDLASYGVVRVLENGSGTTYPGLPWEPKTVFATIADTYDI
ncbi:hypothetical protein NRB56_67720 [Nocardia sp. RB56]|uniref:Abortive infection protein n=1 Tax=Nocardia aurantia TaxID=2585199 RepID=A0A7K0E1Y3_9NOCA|nr:hypothetical protein [Nocardia aurantia]